MNSGRVFADNFFETPIEFLKGVGSIRSEILKKEFNISIPDEQAETITSVGQAISYVEQNVAK